MAKPEEVRFTVVITNPEAIESLRESRRLVSELQAESPWLDLSELAECLERLAKELALADAKHARPLPEIKED